MSGIAEEYGVAAKAIPSDEEIAAAANGHAKLELVNATAFMASNLPEPDQIVRGILHQGSKFCIGGASKACKTWSLLDLALSISQGRQWISFETVKGRVLYINFEIQPFAWQRRIHTVAERRDIQDLSNIELLNLRGQANDYTSLIPMVVEAAHDQKFALIIIDPIYKLYGHADENSARDVANLMNSIERLAVESGAAVAYASHFSKGNQSQKEALDRVSGSGVFARDPDCFLVLTRHAQEDCFTVEPVLRNFAPVPSFVVKWDFPLLIPQEHLDPEDLKKPGGRPITYSESDLLSSLKDSSLSTTEFLKTCKSEFGVSPASFYRLLKSLESDGKLLKSKINNKWSRVVKG